jgi:ABC-2 type transport system ATP-binding protein
MNAVEVRALSRRFAATQALEEVSFLVASGELCAVVGPDGAGKTTLVRILCGLLRPHGGQVSVLSHPLPREVRIVRRSVGYLSQGFTLYGDLSVDENLAFMARLHGVKDFALRREELLSFTRLSAFHDRPAALLSGGMKKKLALAATLVHRPRLILLDEPTTGVDPVSRRDFWILLSTLRDQGISILLTTPYLDEAERCDRVLMLHRGRVLEWNRPAQLTASLKDRVFELTVPAVRQAADLLRRKFADRIQVQLFGDRLDLLLPPTHTEQTLRRIGALIDSSGLGPVTVRSRRPRLENAFIAKIQEKEAV